MTVFCGAVEDQHGEGAIDHGDHPWDLFIDGRWSGRDVLLMTFWTKDEEGLDYWRDRG